jgi:hypothetical protein
MAGASKDDDVRAHIESIASRSQLEVRRLTERLSGRSWPGGASDRSEPGALGWLTRWNASGPVPLTPLCGCASGRCLLCN